MDPNFDFCVGGIEDGIVAALKSALALGNTPAPDAAPGYVREIVTYGGELDGDRLKKALAELTPNLPLMLVSYGDGEDVLFPGLSTAFGQPRIFQHRCHFSVICCSDDARGEDARRRGVGGDPGVYTMLSDAQTVLAGVAFRVDGTLINPEGLVLAGIEYVARLADLTAYAVHFHTWFKYVEPDRRAAGTAVHTVVVDVEVLNGQQGANDEAPGVFVE